MTFTIEKNVPMPKGRTTAKYPYAQMEVGDSFLIPCSGDAVATVLKRMKTSKFVAGKRLGIKLSVATDNGGVRVWRAA